MIEEKVVELRNGRVFNVIFAILLVLPLYLVFYVVTVLFNYRSGWWVAWLVLLAFLAIGFVTLIRGRQQEWETYSQPFPVWNGSSYAANRAIGQVLGPAYFIKEFILATVSQFISALEKSRKIAALEQVDPQQAAALVSDLRSRGTTPRFHPAYEFAAYDNIMVPLLAVDILWMKREGKVTLIGLNRRYDKDID